MSFQSFKPKPSSPVLADRGQPVGLKSQDPISSPKPADLDAYIETLDLPSFLKRGLDVEPKKKRWAGKGWRPGQDDN